MEHKDWGLATEAFIPSLSDTPSLPLWIQSLLCLFPRATGVQSKGKRSGGEGSQTREALEKGVNIGDVVDRQKLPEFSHVWGKGKIYLYEGKEVGDGNVSITCTTVSVFDGGGVFV